MSKDMYVEFFFIFFAIVGNCVYNMDPNSLENRLHDALMRSNTELNNYRKLYKQLQDENLSLHQIAKDLDTQNKCMNQTNVNLYQRNLLKSNVIEQLEKDLAQHKLPRMRKRLQDMTSKSQIRHRKKVYKKAILKTIKSFPDAISANVSIDVGSEWMTIRFGEKDLYQTPTAQDIINARNVAQDHGYSFANSEPMEYDDMDSDDSDSSDIILHNGKISQRHKRCVAHVMDLHKISEKAYHELRMSCKGILPPLCQIRKERTLMSSEIPYIVNPTVSEQIFFDFFNHIMFRCVTDFYKQISFC